MIIKVAKNSHLVAGGMGVRIVPQSALRKLLCSGSC